MVYYGEGHVKSILNSLGIKIVLETDTQYNCFCPFHHNTSTPAFTVNKSEGLWICFNQSCAKRGNLIQLVERLSGRSDMEALRFITMKEPDAGANLSDLLDEMFAPKVEWPSFPQQVVDQLVENYWNNEQAQKYMRGRGFDAETDRHFEIGYSPKLGGQITYPVHTPNGESVVGVVGRGLASKFFDNSKGLPKKRVLHNLDRARRASSSVIVVESGFDAHRIHQSGFPNVVATLGASLGGEQIQLMERNFTKILVFSDNDDAGMGMRKTIENAIKTASVLHCAWDYGTLYPTEGLNGGVPKDAGDLSVEQIKHMVNNPLTSYDAGLP